MKMTCRVRRLDFRVTIGRSLHYFYPSCPFISFWNIKIKGIIKSRTKGQILFCFLPFVNSRVIKKRGPKRKKKKENKNRGEVKQKKRKKLRKRRKTNKTLYKNLKLCFNLILDDYVGKLSYYRFNHWISLI